MGEEFQTVKRKPKVLIFIYNANKIGGPTTAMRLIMNSWLKQKYEFEEIGIHEKLGKIPRLCLINKLRKQIKKSNPDIVHVSGLQLHGFYAVIAARLAGCKNVLTVVRGSSTDALGITKVKRWVFGKIIEPITLRCSKVVYTVCNAMAERPLIQKNTKIFGGVVHNAIPEINMNNYNQHSFRNEQGFSDDDVLLVYTGRVTKDKGLQYALGAISQIEDVNIKFVICGDGPDLRKIQREYINLLNSRKVVMLGARDDIIRILLECDIFLFPTLHENLSNSLLEACAVGLPIIATSVGGNPEVIKDGFNGLLVPPRNELAIRQAIEALTKDKQKMKELGENARTVALNKFSQDKIYNQVDKLYQLVQK